MNITLTQIPQRPGAKKQQFIVSLDGKQIGMIEKLGPFPGERHPWKAFAAGIEPTSKMRCVGAFYLGATYKGQSAAVAMVVSYATIKI